ncbi:hypothetical protein TNCV_4017811 [Trichonephila clavipes]|nr:hypothetical protein TNCV_4017811 [Trichonephila clavipes]
MHSYESQVTKNSGQVAKFGDKKRCQLGSISTINFPLNRPYNISGDVARCPGLKYPKAMAYYYGDTHQNVINSSSMDWNPLQDFLGRTIGHMSVHYPAAADDKLFTLTSIVKMWTPQKKMQ